MPPEEMAHDEELVDAIMDGGPSYALEMVENLRARIGELEAALVEAIAQLRYYKDALPINRSMLCDTPEEFQAELREKAHAALQQTGSQAAHSVVIRSEVMWFAEQMERKLRANDHKGGWRNDYIRHLNYRLGLEQVELNVALTKGIAEEIISEAADVANFAMMVADLAHDPPKNSLHEYIRSQAAPEEGEDGN
jgi:phosphoribosyl-ATP pyrophosphohydrolase